MQNIQPHLPARRFSSIGGRTRSGFALAALLTTAVSATAQSAITIYGIVDQGATKANNGTTPGTSLSGRGAADQWELKAGNSSRIGFRGKEDLAGGLYARFHLEHRFVADTGAATNASVFWLGRSVVALGSNELGEVYAGREYSPAYWIALAADPTAWSYVSQTGAAYTYANYVPAFGVEPQAFRWSNAVGYKSPALSGVTAEVAVAAGEGKRKRAEAGNVQYKQGPLWVGVGHDRLDGDTNLTIASAGYDFGKVRPTASYTRVNGGLNGNAKAFTLAAGVPLSFGRAYASFGSLSPADGLDSKMLGAGGEYNLSKRTLLYSNVGSAKRDGSTRTSAFDLGIKHTF